MDFIFDKEILNDIQKVISLYKKFDRYKDYTREDIYYHILPSIKLNQYKIHKNGDEVIAFTNWAFLDKKAEDHFIKTGDIEFWNCGDKLWHVDTICVKNIKKIMAWTKKYFTKTLGLNQPINWLRISDDNKVYRKQTRLTKRSWL
jgi:hemolysin-activating ACP:hemolysin acyltransferase